MVRVRLMDVNNRSLTKRETTHHERQHESLSSVTDFEHPVHSRCLLYSTTSDDNDKAGCYRNSTSSSRHYRAATIEPPPANKPVKKPKPDNLTKEAEEWLAAVEARDKGGDDAPNLVIGQVAPAVRYAGLRLPFRLCLLSCTHHFLYTQCCNRRI